ncbi:hypothetical protein GQ651_04330 [Alphaproteobacteria bacterium GH1-50]|uniref:Putative Flp pilus-assembly TadG-like N-terminal domain-containing protein n=1 Tax=Kangsaoukella pontilimi TaxID=2691042 RepID=A0A7C9IR51_9RHOB|nr:TadE/TadG family type IV pilus assembly protein [Kangsaoukella pontilimi]MXQ07066.1 hypothetical protein [Kangsaoukella pontilimi]
MRNFRVKGQTLGSLLSQFRRDEAGSLIIFSLYIFIIMLMLGGTAVELMRFEAERKHLQNTIDSAVLAASDLKQTEDSEKIVRSFFEKSGRDPNSVLVNVEPVTLSDGTLTARTVTASAPLTMPTHMMRLAGVETLRTASGGRANEQVQNVEISLVLDISGSMRWGTGNTETTPNRISELRRAVETFVNVVLQIDCDVDGTNCTQSTNTASTTINVIPYAGHVNPGRPLFDVMGGNRWHEWSSCIEVTDADFNDSALPSRSKNQLPHFMKWTIAPAYMNWGWCPKDNAGILVAENDGEVLKQFIRDIRLHDGTATHVGMKYGLALLDPSSRSVLGTLAANGDIKSDYALRPANYEDDVVKYIVLMTDGQTTDQFRPDDFAYTDVYGPENAARANVMSTYGSTTAGGVGVDPTEVEKGYRANTLLRLNGITHNRSRNRQNLQAACNEAKKPVMGIPPGGGGMTVLKEDRVTVFTVAFLAPDAARTDMRTCASSEHHFYDVRSIPGSGTEGLDVATAFASIARTINQLRLTN